MPDTKPYKPANSTEGECFEAHFCQRCWYQRTREHGPQCHIHLRAMMSKITDDDFPVEWIRDSKGIIQCTAFEKRKKFPRPYIIYDGGKKRFFDAVFPGVFSNGVASNPRVGCSVRNR